MSDQSGADWRSDLVKAIHNVFSSERDASRKELRTFKIVHRDKAHTIDALEKKVKEQEHRHDSAMQQIFEADRQSLLAEISQLRSNLAKERVEKQEENRRIVQQLQAVEDQYLKREQNWQKKVEISEYKLSQERVISDDLRSSLELERSRHAEVTSQLSREKSCTSDLKAEVSDLEVNVSKLKDALEREQNRLFAASTALEDERMKSANLQADLASEKTSTEHYIQELEMSKLKSIQQQDSSNQMVQKLQHELSIERDRRQETQGRNEDVTLTIQSLRRELEMERDQHRKTESRYQNKVAELKSELKGQKEKVGELNRALEHEQCVVTELRDTVQAERHSLQEMQSKEKVAIQDLQAMVDMERSKMKDMQRMLEKEQMAVRQMGDRLEQEKTRRLSDVGKEQQVSKLLKNNMELMQHEQCTLKEDLVGQQEANKQLQEQYDSLKVSVESVRKSAEERQQKLMAAKQHMLKIEAVAISYKDKLMNMEEKNKSLEKRTDELKLQLSKSKEIVYELESRHMGGDLQDKAVQIVMEVEHDNCASSLRIAQQRISWLEYQLQSTTPTTKASNRSNSKTLTPKNHYIDNTASPVGVRTPELVRIHGTIEHDDIVASEPVLAVTPDKNLLSTTVQSAPLLDCSLDRERPTSEDMIPNQSTSSVLRSSTKPMRVSTPSEYDVSHIRQQSTLKSEIDRLIRENDRLATLIQKLQKNCDKVKQQAEDRLSNDRKQLEREKCHLTLKLQEAELQIHQLKTSLNTAQQNQRLERDKLMSRTTTTTDVSDKEKIKYLYAKYMRSESFRKALIYQKKYLLLLLGGFRDCEQDTLALLARMGAQPAAAALNRNQRQKPRKFRSVARAVMVIGRLKRCVSKWQDVSQNRSLTNGATHNAQFLPKSRSTQPQTNRYISSGQGHTPSLGLRRDPLGSTPPTRDTDRVRVNGHTREPTVAKRQLLMKSSRTVDSDSESGMDESLNDYIQRLENLQMRLGNTVTTSYGQYHRR